MRHKTPASDTLPTGFGRGTMILTPWGRRAVETLVAGDLIWTPSGMDVVTAVVQQEYGDLRRVQNAALRPIRVGTGAPFATSGYMPLLVGPGQRLVHCAGRAPASYDGANEACTAQELKHLEDVAEAGSEPAFRYVSLFTNGARVIDANGFWAETPVRLPSAIRSPRPSLGRRVRIEPAGAQVAVG